MLEKQVFSVAIGDAFESEGRRRTLWTVEAIIDIPGKGRQVRLTQVDGLGRVTVPATDLGFVSGFHRVDEGEGIRRPE